MIEFSNKFQQYWSEAWYQTLTASYGFLQTLKPEDYVAATQRIYHSSYIALPVVGK